MGVAALVSIGTTIITLMFMHEEMGERVRFTISQGVKDMGRMAKDSIIYGTRHHVIFWFVLASLILTFAFQPLNMYWSPRFYALAHSQVLIVGWAWVGIAFFMMIGGLIVGRLLKREVNYFFMFLITLGILAIPIFIAATSESFYFVFTTFLTYEIGRGMLNPLQKSYLNKHISEGKIRATVLSFNSMMSKLGAGAGLVIMGVIAQNHSIQLTWILSALIILAMIPIFFRIASNEKKLALLKEGIL